MGAQGESIGEGEAMSTAFVRKTLFGCCIIPFSQEDHQVVVFEKVPCGTVADASKLPSIEIEADGKFEAHISSELSEQSEPDPEGSPSGDPLGPGEYLVDIFKDNRGAGFDIEAHGNSILVARLKSGALEDWNLAHEQDHEFRVRLGDRVVRVNGVEGESQDLVQELKKKGKMRIIFRRAREFNVNVHKAGRELGICVNAGHEKLDMLKVSATRPGAVEDWGQANPGRAVQGGDRILAVNGIRGDPPTMMQELAAKDMLDMIFVRPL